MEEVSLRSNSLGVKCWKNFLSVGMEPQMMKRFVSTKLIIPTSESIGDIRRSGRTYLQTFAGALSHDGSLLLRSCGRSTNLMMEVDIVL